MTDGINAANLHKVEHIVVLMMENRSFDHMLGYLSLEGGRGDIDGLRPEFANTHDGRRYPVHHLGTTAIGDDPDHSADAVDLQLGGEAMDGFVASFAKTLADRGVPSHDAAAIMGYYNATDVPVYDHLAREFAICDRWFSSVPGATWPNRLYAICGRAAGSRDDRPPHVPPIYNQPSFVRHLDAHGISWRWYSFEAGTLRLADAHYRLGHHERFAFFSKQNLNWKERLEVEIDAGSRSFLEDAAGGTLPSLAWIDPNFSNFNPIGFQPNDDHAPADIKDGQELVLAVYHALASGPQWAKTLLIVFYDEHGGFFDHVPPPPAPDDDLRRFGRYGVRVPALIVSPWVNPGVVSHTGLTTPRSPRRSCCGSALTHSASPHGLMGRSAGSSGWSVHSPWEPAWRRPTISGNCSPAYRRGRHRTGTRSSRTPRHGPLPGSKAQRSAKTRSPSGPRPTCNGASPPPTASCAGSGTQPGGRNETSAHADPRDIGAQRCLICAP